MNLRDAGSSVGGPEAAQAPTVTLTRATAAPAIMSPKLLRTR